MQRKWIARTALTLALVATAGGAQAEPATQPAAQPASAYAVLLNNQGKEIGQAHFQQGTEGVLMQIKLAGLPAGWHGMHFHTVGDCSDHAEFQHAKGHIMPDNKPHGFVNPQGPHAGNLPNLVVHTDGTAEVELYSQMVSLHGRDGQPALLDKDGSTLMIHAQKDDHLTQPIGGSGARIACGVIRVDETVRPQATAPSVAPSVPQAGEHTHSMK